MNALLTYPLTQEHAIYLLAAPRAVLRRWLPGWMAQFISGALACRPAALPWLRVLDGGNCFDGYGLARALRRETAGAGQQFERLLEGVSVARAFTCYQMVTLLMQTPAQPQPTLVLELLATFCDENIRLAERCQLLRESITHLQRLSRGAPVAVSVSLPAAYEPCLFEMLHEAADHLWRLEAPLPPEPPRMLW